MKLSRVWLLGAALAFAGCDDDGTTAPVNTLDSTIRYYNVIPDTVAVTVRPMDFVEPHTHIPGLLFRDSSGHYMQTHSGARQFSVFYGVQGTPGNDPALSQIKFLDASFGLNAAANYTAYFVGFTRSGANPRLHAFLTEDNPPTPAAGQWAARAVHVAVGQGLIDVYVYRGAVIPATPTWGGAAFEGPTGYVSFATASDYSVTVCPAGAPTTDASCRTRALAAGSAGTTTGNLQDPIPGTNIAGSVFSLAVFPPSVAGSRAPQTAPAFTGLFVKAVVDRRPARTGP
jgi:hypothetical protein